MTTSPSTKLKEEEEVVRKMSKSQSLRALVSERLTAAAEDIFALVERTIAEYEAELCRCKEENQRKQEILDSVLNAQILLHATDVQIHSSPESGLKQEIPETPQIKEEPEEQSWAKQEEEELPLFTETDNIIISQVSTLCDVTGQHDHSVEQTSSCSQTKKETHLRKSTETTDTTPLLKHGPEKKNSEADGDKYDQVQNKDTRTAANKSTLFSKRKSAAETRVRDGHTTGTGAGEWKIHECSFCGKRLTTKQILERHTRIHTGEKPFSCSVCNKSFNQKPELDVHMRKHTGEKPYSCSVCQRAFSDRSVLLRHKVVHTGEKPYSCTVCLKAFTHPGTLSRHKVIHTGEKPFCCPVCKQTFTQNISLKIHMRRHTGEKPYS